MSVRSVQYPVLAAYLNGTKQINRKCMSPAINAFSSNRLKKIMFKNLQSIVYCIKFKANIALNAASPPN